MTGNGVTVQDYLKELEHAAGSGASRIVSSVTASGNVQAKTGIDVPGPALRSLLAGNKQRSSRTADAVNTDRIPRIADRMAKDALRQGAALLSGKSKS